MASRREIVNCILDWVTERKLELIFDVTSDERMMHYDLPDLFIAIPMGKDAGLWIRLGKGKPADKGLRKLGFSVVECYGTSEALYAIDKYLHK